MFYKDTLQLLENKATGCTTDLRMSSGFAFLALWRERSERYRRKSKS